MAKHNKTGEKGEIITSNFLVRKGFSIIDRNYRKKWGEIDIVAQKDNKIHFVEVKTVSRKSFNGKFPIENNNYRAEDNMHPWKLERLSRAIQTYLLGKYKEVEPAWQLDLATVTLDQENKVAKIKLIENIIL